MSKNNPPPVCPYACKFSDISQIIGRTPRSPETLRKHIDKALDTMFAAGDFWTLEYIRRTLVALTAFDKRSIYHGIALQNLVYADEQQLSRILYWQSVIVHPRTQRRTKEEKANADHCPDHR